MYSQQPSRRARLAFILPRITTTLISATGLVIFIILLLWYHQRTNSHNANHAYKILPIAGLAVSLSYNLLFLLVVGGGNAHWLSRRIQLYAEFLCAIQLAVLGYVGFVYDVLVDWKTDDVPVAEKRVEVVGVIFFTVASAAHLAYFCYGCTSDDVEDNASRGSVHSPLSPLASHRAESWRTTSTSSFGDLARVETAASKRLGVSISTPVQQHQSAAKPPPVRFSPISAHRSVDVAPPYNLAHYENEKSYFTSGYTNDARRAEIDSFIEPIRPLRATTAGAYPYRMPQQLEVTIPTSPNTMNTIRKQKSQSAHSALLPASPASPSSRFPVKPQPSHNRSASGPDVGSKLAKKSSPNHSLHRRAISSPHHSPRTPPFEHDFEAPQGWAVSPQSRDSVASFTPAGYVTIVSSAEDDNGLGRL